VKGLVRTSASADPMVIHGVQHAMHPPVHVAAAENDQPSFLVFITRGLAREPITQSLSRFSPRQKRRCRNRLRRTEVRALTSDPLTGTSCGADSRSESEAVG
jgi:hypothetical protein